MSIYVPFTLLILTLFVSCKHVPSSVEITEGHQTATNQITKEAAENYNVYNVVINGAYIRESGELIIIEDQTSLPGEVPRIRQLIEGSILKDPATQDILDDFLTKNAQVHPLGNNFNLNAKYVLISSVDQRQLFQTDNGWTEFNNKYPAARGILSLSQVGYNRERNLALVCIGYQSGMLSGGGDFVLLAKENGDWVIKRKVTAWAI